MFKKSIDFTDRQIAFLEKEAKRLEISIAEYIRRMLEKRMDK